MALHRVTFMGEKKLYYARSREGAVDLNQISTNADGMDQFKTCVPLNVGK